MSEVRLYVEGDEGLKKGFDQFLSAVKGKCRGKLRFRTIFGGSTDDTIRSFSKDCPKHPKAACLLLVDAEGSIEESPTRHLAARHNWSPVGAMDQHHLMVVMMESWLLADPEALAAYYGSGFRRELLPRADNLEQVEKRRVEEALRRATEGTRKGSYFDHKLAHGGELLTRIESTKVRARAPHCERLFQTLEGLVG